LLYDKTPKALRAQNSEKGFQLMTGYLHQDPTSTPEAEMTILAVTEFAEFPRAQLALTDRRQITDFPRGQ